MPPSHARQAATGTLLVAIAITTSVALTTYKAATAPITYDEAYTLLRFARKHTNEILSDYQYPNNHILHTLAVRISTRTFGDALWAVRLPGLLGGLALLAGVVTLARRFDEPIRSGWPIAVAFLPVVMEYNGLARGYSIGAAACFWAALLLIDELEIEKTQPRRSRRNNIRLFLVGAMLGVSVGCVPTFGVFVAGLLAATLLLRLLAIRPIRLRSAAGDGSLIALGLIPVLLVAYGRVRIKPREWPWGFGDWQSCNQAFWEHTLAWPGAIGTQAALAVSALIAVSTIVACAASFRTRHAPTQFLLATFIFAVAALISARAILATVWPLPRTIHWLAPFSIWTILIAITFLLRSRKAAHIASATIVATIVSWSTARYDSRRFAGWEDNAAVPAALRSIDRHAAEQSPGTIVINVPWQLDVCVEYRIRHLPKRRWKLSSSPATAADYSISLPGDATTESRQILFEDAESGIRALHHQQPNPPSPTQ